MGVDIHWLNYLEVLLVYCSILTTFIYSDWVFNCGELDKEESPVKLHALCVTIKHAIMLL